MKRFIIYRTTNKIDGKFYIGQHVTKNLEDGYLGSGKRIGYAIKKYGPENFIREILFDFDTLEEMNEKEKELVTEDLIKDPMCYNINTGGNGSWWHVNASGKAIHEGPRPKETRDKIAKSKTGLKATPEHRENISKGLKRRIFTAEWCKKISEAASKRHAANRELRKNEGRTHMLIDTIKADRILAMKAKDTAKKDLLGVLVAECTKTDKYPDDATVVAAVKKMHVTAHENWERMSGSDDPRMGPYLREEAILFGYIPSQLTEDAIDLSVRYAINLGASNVGGVMLYFKNNFAGRYDGRSVSDIAKRALAE